MTQILNELESLRGEVKERRDTLVILMALRFMTFVTQIIIMTVAPEIEVSEKDAKKSLINYGMIINSEMIELHNFLLENSRKEQHEKG